MAADTDATPIVARAIHACVLCVPVEKVDTVCLAIKLGHTRTTVD